MQFQAEKLAKIILLRVQIKDINIKLFYKLPLEIKSRYIYGHLNKQINKKKKPVRISHA